MIPGHPPAARLYLLEGALLAGARLLPGGRLLIEFHLPGLRHLTAEHEHALIDPYDVLRADLVRHERHGEVRGRVPEPGAVLQVDEAPDARARPPAGRGAHVVGAQHDNEAGDERGEEDARGRVRDAEGTVEEAGRLDLLPSEDGDGEDAGGVGEGERERRACAERAPQGGVGNNFSQ